MILVIGLLMSVSASFASGDARLEPSDTPRTPGGADQQSNIGSSVTNPSTTSQPNAQRFQSESNVKDLPTKADTNKSEAERREDAVSGRKYTTRPVAPPESGR